MKDCKTETLSGWASGQGNGLPIGRAISVCSVGKVPTPLTQDTFWDALTLILLPFSGSLTFPSTGSSALHFTRTLRNMLSWSIYGISLT